MKCKTLLLFIILCGCFAAEVSRAQQNDYNTAAQFIQQQKFEDALPILRNLYEENPAANLFFSKYIETLLHLKELDKAKEVAENHIKNHRDTYQASIKYAEILHLNDEREAALETWDEVIDENESNMQMYYSVAYSMVDRREYTAAIEVYKRAQSEFNNDSLFLNELANTYMQAGQFEKAVNEFFTLVIGAPEQMRIIQQHLLRMRDESLYETAAFELEERLLDLEHSHVAYPQLYQLLTWLLIETEEYQRAFIFARQYENQTSHTVYSLFSLGSLLKSAGEYELAADSFKFYLESSANSARFRAMDELATTYMEWARYLQQNNLETPARQNQLLDDAYTYFTELLNAAPNYRQAKEVFTAIIELSLDHFKDLEKAEMWFEKLSTQTPDDDSFMLYAEGRTAIFKKDYNTARQALTRADRATDDSDLSEKARYYLSMSDFYAGDFDFAEIQFRSLEKRHTSFYSNDAIKKSMWIKNGLRADSTGSLLKTIGDGFHAAHTGSYEEALRLLEPILAKPSNAFADVLTVEFSALFPSSYDSFVLKLLEYQLSRHPQSPLRERLLWNRAVLAEQLVTQKEFPKDIPSGLFEFLPADKEHSYSEEDIAELYEEVIIEFPNGFYASYSRDKLQTLQLTLWLP